MNLLLLFPLLLFALDDTVTANKLTIIVPAKIRTVASRDVAKITTAESEKHAIEGFVANPTAVDCFDEVEYRYTGGRYENEPIKFRLRNPPNLVSGKKYPLIVWFHGKGESDDDNTRQLAHIQKALFHLTGSESLDCYMMATQCPADNPSWTTSISSEGKGDAPLTIAQEIFETVLKEYPIDQERISVFGLSSGGAAVWEFARQNRDRLSAIVPVSSNPPNGSFETDAVIWAFNCTEDTRAPASAVKSLIETINQSGVACLTEVKSSDHDAWTYALSTMKVLRWMSEQKRGELSYPPPGVAYRQKSIVGMLLGYCLPPVLIIGLFLIRRKL